MRLLGRAGGINTRLQRVSLVNRTRSLAHESIGLGLPRLLVGNKYYGGKVWLYSISEHTNIIVSFPLASRVRISCHLNLVARREISPPLPRSYFAAREWKRENDKEAIRYPLIRRRRKKDRGGAIIIDRKTGKSGESRAR